MGYLCGFLTALAVVTVVGHGLWMLFATLLGARTAKQETSPPTSSFAGDLTATERQLNRFHNSGQLDFETYSRVRSLVETERKRQLTRSLATPVESAPKPMPPLERAPVAPPASQPTPVPPAPPTPLPPRPPTVLVRPATQPPLPPPVQLRPVPPRPPRRPFAEVLAAFMESKNIYWGELVAGLLIIGSTVALVFYFWQDIASGPVLKFFLFTAALAAMFGVGLYTQHRWKLPQTSRGLLIIASLLVPLNFIAIAAFAKGAEVASGGGWTGQSFVIAAGELVALATFIATTWFAGRVLAPGWPGAVVAGVVGPCVAQLLIRRYAGPEMSWPALLAFALLPLAFHATSLGAVVHLGRRWRGMSVARAHGLLITLGLTCFSTAAALAFLLYKTADAAESIRHVAIAVSLYGTPALAVGALLWQKCARKNLASLRITGASIAIAGAFTLLVGVPLALPSPGPLVAVALFDFAALTWLALRLKLPAAHLAAGACAALASLVAWHAFRGHVGWINGDGALLRRALISAESSWVLLAVSVVFASAREFFDRFRRAADGTAYAWLARGAAALSIAIVSVHGLGHGNDHGATWIYLFYAVAAFAFAARRASAPLTWVGATLLLLAVVQGLIFRFRAFWPVNDPARIALLFDASLTLAGAAAVSFIRRGREVWRRVFQAPLATFAAAVSLTACAYCLRALSFNTSTLTATAATLAIHFVWLGLIWMALAVLMRWNPFVLGFQIVLAIAVALGVVAHLTGQAWFQQSTVPLLEPWSVQAITVSLALLSLAWMTVRLAVQHAPLRSDGSFARWHERAAELLEPEWSWGDRALTGIAAVVLSILALVAVLPAISNELHPTRLVSAVSRAAGPGSWLLWGMLLTTLVSGLWERFDARRVLGVVCLLVPACGLLAAQAAGAAHAATSLRWLLALLWLAVSIALWNRATLARFADRLRWPGFETRSTSLAPTVWWLMTALAGAPVVALSLLIPEYPPVSGTAATFFDIIGRRADFAIPLVILAAGLLGHALRESDSRVAFAGGLMLNFAVSIAYVVLPGGGVRVLDSTELVYLAEFNAIASALFSLVWLAAVRFRHKPIEGRPPHALPGLLKVKVGLAVAFEALAVLPAILLVLIEPTAHTASMVAAGRLWSWLAAALATAAVFVARSHDPAREGKRLFTLEAVCCVALSVVALLSLNFLPWDNGNWLSYQVMLIGAAAVAWLPLAYSRLIERDNDATASLAWVSFDRVATWSIGLTALAATIALRGVMDTHVGHPWWCIGVLASLALLHVVLAWRQRRPGFLYSAAALLHAAVTTWFWFKWPASGATWFIELARVHVLALVPLAGISFAMSRRRFEPDAWENVPPLHALAAWLGVLVAGALAAHGFGGDVLNDRVVTNFGLAWAALAAGGAMMLAGLWDRRGYGEHAGLYIAGLAAILLGLDQADLNEHWLKWAICLAFAGYTIATGGLWRLDRRWPAWRGAICARRTSDARATSEPWLLPINGVLVGVVVVLAFVIDLTFEPARIGAGATAALLLRLVAATAAVSQVAALGLLARPSDEPRGMLREAALFVGALGAVAWAWAWLDPAPDVNEFLDRCVLVMTGLAGAAVLYAGAAKSIARGIEDNALDTELRPPSVGWYLWTNAIETVLPTLLGLALAMLLFTIGAEVTQWIQLGGRAAVEMSMPAILAVAVALPTAAAVAIVFAVVPGRDPLGLSERGRTAYVYATEVLLALLFVHIRITMPWLFHGFFQQFWPLIVLFIAFLGAGLSEYFERRKITVLASPLRNTGALLPLLPALGYWTLQPIVPYPVVMLIAGLIYGVLSVTRKSFAFGLLAAVAGNFGLWYFFHHHTNLPFLQHPQLWLIPAALSVLAAAYANRQSLTEAQLASIRYLCVMLIYVSSTAEIFIRGIDKAPYLPMVLAALSIAGVMAGIAMRVRSYLYLGTAFLTLAVVTMIHQASLNHGWWMWAVAGIALGAGMIVVFALFERRREQMTAMMAGLKQWKA